jgi:hypothetical protein
MSGGGIDRFFCLCCISQIDAAELDPLGCWRELVRSMIDAGNSRAARKGFLGHHLAKRAQRAGEDNDFPLSACPRHAYVTHHVFHLIIVCRTLIARPA